MAEAGAVSRPAEPRRPDAGGFSLVELLVVLVVMAVLAALIAGAVGRAAEEANLVACRSNLHGLGLALLVYAKDHQGALPVSGTLDGPHPDLAAALARGAYLADPRAYYCPAETQPDRQFSEANVAAGRIGYFYFSCEQAPTNRLLSTFLRWNVRWPRRLHTTMAPDTWVASDAWLSAEPTAHRFFKKGVNYLTLGGAVHMVDESPREAFR